MSAQADATWREELRSRALALPDGERLPSERSLAEEWGVARMTVRSAIAGLAREGLLRTVPGSGTVRVPQPISLRVRLGSFAAAVESQGMEPSTRLLDLRREARPPHEVVEHLGSGAVFVVRRLRLGDGVPLALEEAWLPCSLVGGLDDAVATGSLYAHLASLGLLPDHAEETVRADLGDAEEVRLLRMSASRPVLRLTRRSLHGKVPVEYARAVFPADRHELNFSLDADQLNNSG